MRTKNLSTYQLLLEMYQQNGSDMQARYIFLPLVWFFRVLQIMQDEPMKVWRDHVQEFLHEMLRHEGLGGDQHDPKCFTCGSKFSHRDMPNATSADSMHSRITCCKDCFGQQLECGECCLERHQRLPLHVIQVSFCPTYICLYAYVVILQEWNGRFWKKTTLKELGLVVQFSHSGGPCLNPGPLLAGTMIEHNGIHQVSM
jgi:hypothetical protein